MIPVGVGVFLLDTVSIDQLDTLSPFATSQLLSTLLVSVRARHKDKTESLISQDPNHTIERYMYYTTST